MKALLKYKNKRNLCILFVLYHGVPDPWYEVHILSRSYEKTNFNLGDYVTESGAGEAGGKGGHGPPNKIFNDVLFCKL